MSKKDSWGTIMKTVMKILTGYCGLCQAPAGCLPVSATLERWAGAVAAKVPEVGSREQLGTAEGGVITLPPLCTMEALSLAVRIWPSAS